MGYERGETSLTTIVLAVLVLGAVTAAPLLLMGRQQEKAVDSGLGAISQANDVAAQADLRTAIRAAQVYYAEGGSYSGFGPDAASEYEPSITFTSGAATRGAVSIRGASVTSVVMVTESPSGDVLCVAANMDAMSFGRKDAQTASACTGGW